MTQSVHRQEIDRFRELVVDRLGLSFDDSRRGGLTDLLRRQADASNLTTAAFLERLATADCPAAELHELAQALTVTETYCGAPEILPPDCARRLDGRAGSNPRSAARSPGRFSAAGAGCPAHRRAVRGRLRGVAGRPELAPGGVRARRPAPGARRRVLGATRSASRRAWAKLRLSDAPERHSCRPSVDVLFESVARECSAAVAACLLTGMGRDGASGLLAIRRAGGVTIAQDEATSVVYGMPREAVLLGAAERVLPLPEIGPALAALAARAETPR